MNVNKLQAIIFDVDGTLADTEEVHRLAFNHVFQEFGLDWHWSPDLYRELLAISGGRERIAAYGSRLRGRFANDAAFNEFVVTMHQAKTRKYAALLRAGEVQLRPGIGRLIDAARAQNIALGIATSSTLSNVVTLLDHNLPADWRTWFSAIETCDSVPTKKPSPAVYNAAVTKLDRPRDTIVVLEDTQNGLAAARAADLLTIVTVHRFTREHSFPGAALVVDSVGEPDQAFTVLHGDAGHYRYVDLSLLDILLEQAENMHVVQSAPRLRASA